MKKNTRGKRVCLYLQITAVALAFVMMLTLTGACDMLSNGSNGNHHAVPGTPSVSGTQNPESNGPAGSATIGPELTPLGGPPAIPVVLTPVASGKQTESNDKAVIDYSNATDGYVMIKWTGGAVERGLRVQVIGPSETTYTYILNTAGDFEIYPLSDGNGSYTIRVVDLLTDGRGSVAISATVKVTLADEFGPFLHPNQYVNFNEESAVVAKASSLLTADLDLISKIGVIYGFVIDNISYDVDFANEIRAGRHPNYLPDLDDVLMRRKGICFDFAAVMAAMLRSQGIPVKLVVGNVNGDVRHAWLSVYSEIEGWINAVIYFAEEEWQMMDPTFASAGSSSSLKDFIGDGSNYTELYLY